VNALEHALIGAGALHAHLTGGDLPLMILGGALAGRLPDIDSPWAKRYPPHSTSCGLLSHRGPTQSLVAVLVVPAASVLFRSMCPHSIH